ncbi:MAG: glycerol-3-phosphate dehydrogenase C-terminal domain-containing protein, partial [Caulobacteraceae bacterium]
PRNEVCYIGTTDIFAPGPDAWPRVDPDQVAYLLAAAAANLTIPPLGPKDVVSVWAGARPLIAQPGRSPSEISRKDELLRGPGGMLSIAGGKLTAYRAMAERVVDQVEAILSRRTTRCRTATAPLPGGEREFSTILAELARLSLDGGEADRLARLYGTEASELLAEGGGPAAEGRRAVLVEGALGLEDWWVRRSGRAWFDLDAGTGALAMAAEAMAPLLAWSKEETAAQIEACRQVHERDMASVRAAPVRTR